jgi:hypothetical protein
MFKKKQEHIEEQLQPKPKKTVLQWAEELAYHERDNRICARLGCGYARKFHDDPDSWYWSCCPEFLDIADKNANKEIK